MTKSSTTNLPSYPTVAFHPLAQCDGSASYTWAGHTIIASVNGPIEPQRRDELPEEAHLEVNLREASGGGSPHTRHLETILQRTFTSLVLTRAHPRTLVQITLQLLHKPPFYGVNQSCGLIALPHLVNAGILAVVDANVPMRGTATGISVLTRMTGDLGHWKGGVELVTDEEGRDVDDARRAGRSLQAFVYSGEGEILLAEGEGACATEEWDEVAEAADGVCAEMCGTWLRELVEERMEETGRWRSSD